MDPNRKQAKGSFTQDFSDRKEKRRMTQVGETRSLPSSSDVLDHSTSSSHSHDQTRKSGPILMQKTQGSRLSFSRSSSRAPSISPTTIKDRRPSSLAGRDHPPIHITRQGLAGIPVEWEEEDERTRAPLPPFVLDEKLYFSHQSRALFCILLVVAAERTCYYTLLSNYRPFLKWLGLSNALTDALYTTLQTSSSLSTFAAAWAADSWLGCYRGVLISVLGYTIAAVLAAVMSHPDVAPNRGVVLFAFFVCFTTGVAFFKSNVAPFLGAQFNVALPGEDRRVESFFAYYYVFINIGAGISYGYLSLLAAKGEPTIGVDLDHRYFATFLVSALVMAVGMMVFFFGSKFYEKPPPKRDPLLGLIYYIWQSAQRNRKGKIAFFGWCMVLVLSALTVIILYIKNTSAAAPLTYITLLVTIITYTCLVYAHRNNDYLAEVPDHPSDYISLADAQDWLDMVPLVLVINGAFGLGYQGFFLAFPAQACQMNLFVTARSDVQIPGLFFSVGDCLTIIIFVPILELVLYPLVAKVKGSPVTFEEKFFTGLMATVFAMLSAAALEFARRGYPVLLDRPDSECAPSGIKMSDISAYYMLIPYCLLGLAECLVYPVLYFFVFDQAPKGSRCLAAAFNFFCLISLSNGFTWTLSTALREYVTNDLNDGHLEYLYIASASCALLGIPIIHWLFNSYVYKDNKAEVRRVCEEPEWGQLPTPNVTAEQMIALNAISAPYRRQSNGSDAGLL